MGHLPVGFGGSLQCVIRFSYARRDGVQGRALREAQGDGAAAALRRSWMPVVVSVVLQQSLQSWREAFDDAAKPGRKKRVELQDAKECL